MERYELEILKKAVENAITNGFLQASITPHYRVDLLIDPPSISVSCNTADTSAYTNYYLDPLFPLTNRDWAIAFFGRELMGNAYFGALPAWKYHQHRLLEFLQNNEMKEFYSYIETFL